MGILMLSRSSKGMTLSWDLCRRKEVMLELQEGLGNEDGERGTCVSASCPACPQDAPWGSKLGDTCVGN